MKKKLEMKNALFKWRMLMYEKNENQMEVINIWYTNTPSLLLLVKFLPMRYSRQRWLLPKLLQDL